jgi:HSP20 family protein
MNNTCEKRMTPADQAERTRSGNTYIPAVDIVEAEDELLLIADVPGANPDAIDIDFDRGQLTINARVEARQGTDTEWVHREFGIGDFVRTFQVGETIDAERIAAECNNGVLTLHLPKAAAARTRKIAVQAV